MLLSRGTMGRTGLVHPFTRSAPSSIARTPSSNQVRSGRQSLLMNAQHRRRRPLDPAGPDCDSAASPAVEHHNRSAGDHAPGHVSRAVGGSVIDDDELGLAEGLGFESVEELGERLSPVLDWHHHRHSG